MKTSRGSYYNIKNILNYCHTAGRDDIIVP